MVIFAYNAKIKARYPHDGEASGCNREKRSQKYGRLWRSLEVMQSMIKMVHIQTSYRTLKKTL
jgi:hypothetical protein